MPFDPNNIADVQKLVDASPGNVAMKMQLQKLQTQQQQKPAAAAPSSNPSLNSFNSPPPNSGGITQQPQSSPGLGNMTPSGLYNAQNQSIKQQVGYKGGFGDPQEWQNWAKQNVGAYGQYLQQGRTASPNFQPVVDFNPAQAGVQTYGPEVEKYIGNNIGYYGDNLMGSGYLNQPNNMQAYTQMRQIFDPGYQGMQQQQQNYSPPQQPSAPSSPYHQQDLMQLPASLQALQGLSDSQQRSSIATNALYGMGADPDSQQYYLNMLQHGLVDSQGNVGQMNLLPIESNYLQSLGLPISSSTDFLDAVARLNSAGNTQ